MLLLFAGCQDRCHPSALHTGRLVDLGHILKFFDEPTQDVHSLILIDDVSPSELNPGLDLVAVIEEGPRVLRLEVEVVRVGVRTESHLLHLNVLRLLAGFLLFLLELVPILSVVDDFTDGRIGAGGNFYEVELVITRASKSLLYIDDSMVSVRVDETNSGCANFLVDANFSCDGFLSLM